jgi:antitoxin VapB
METAKIFMNGRSEAVRLPKDFRFGSKEVYIKKIGDLVMLIPKKEVWNTFVASLDEFSSDFMTERGNEKPQTRPGI